MNLRPLLTIFLLVFSFFAFGANDLKNRPYLLAPVEYDGVELGTLYVYPKHKKLPTLIERIAFLRLISPYLSDQKTLESLKGKHLSRFVPLEQFIELGVVVFFDEEGLVLRTSIRPQLITKSKIDLISGSNRVRKSPIQNPFMSGYANMYLNQYFSNYNSVDKEIERDNFNASSDAALSVGEFILDSGFISEENAENDFIRKDTRIIHDFSDVDTRLYVGEHTFSSVGFQVEDTGAGITFEKDSSFRAVMVQRGNDNHSIILDQRSEVTVIVNGNVVHKQNYPAGPVDFSNFPVSSGTNNIVLKIKNSSGKEEVVEYSQLFDSELLGTGVSEFNFTVDSKMTNEDDHRTYDSKYRTSSWLMYGVNDFYTAGANFQVESNYTILGLENNFMSSLGIAESSFALSDNKNKNQDGIGFRFSFRNHDMYKGKTPFAFVRGSFEFRDKNFLQYGQSENDLRYYSQAFISKQFLKMISFGFGGSYREFYENSSRSEIKTDMNTRLFNNWSININVSRSITNDKSFSNETKALVSLNWYPRTSSISNVTAKYESEDGSLSVGANGQGTLIDNVVNYDGEVGKTTSGKYIDSSVTMLGNRGEVGLDYYSAQSDSFDRHQFGVNSQFALAFAGNKVALGPTIYESFAIVDADPRDDDLEIPVTLGNNISNSSINNFGPALLPSLAPYQYYEVGYDLNSIPEKYHLSETFVAIVPKYKIGSLIEAIIEERISVVGVAVDQLKKSITLSSGEVLDKDKKTYTNFFTNKSGRFFVEQIPRGTYYLRFDSGEYEDLEFHVNVNDTGFVDFGVISAYKKVRP